MALFVRGMHLFYPVLPSCPLSRAFPYLQDAVTQVVAVVPQPSANFSHQQTAPSHQQTPPRLEYLPFGFSDSRLC